MDKAKVSNALREVVGRLQRRTPNWLELEDLCRKALVASRGSIQESSIEALVPYCVRRESQPLLTATMRVLLILENEENSQPATGSARIERTR